LAEDFCLVVRLDTQSLSRVERSETFLQFVQDIFVHGITSSKIGSSFHGELEALPNTTEYSHRANSLFYRTTWLMPTGYLPGEYTIVEVFLHLRDVRRSDLHRTVVR
jgi:hypothetical protein